jgi:predicted transcriptional regulator
MPKPSQMELEFLNSFELKPLHLLYLTAIYQGDFDTRLQKGHFLSHQVFSARIRELMDAGLVRYDGRHCVTPRGVAHMMHLLEQKVQP